MSKHELGRISLKSVSEFLSEQEMKRCTGGYGTGGYGDGGYGGSGGYDYGDCMKIQCSIGGHEWTGTVTGENIDCYEAGDAICDPEYGFVCSPC